MFAQDWHYFHITFSETVSVQKMSPPIELYWAEENGERNNVSLNAFNLYSE